MRKLVAIGFVLAAFVVAPAAIADSSTALGGYGSSAAKPVVQVKGTSGSNASAAAGAESSGPDTLPFTGTDLGVFLVAGVALLGLGFGLRRLGRDKA